MFRNVKRRIESVGARAILQRTALAATLFFAGPAHAESDRVPALPNSWRERVSARLDESLLRFERAPQTSSPAPAGPAPDQLRSFESLPPLRVVAGRREEWVTPVLGMLRAHGLPEELVAVVSVESGFNPDALSSKGARGLWQLMPETARRYGLVVESHRDERLDPLKSTHAAARYFNDLYTQFSDWPLALAAYNAGENRVERALARLGASDFWTLARHAALPRETREYVPAVLSRAGTAFEAKGPDSSQTHNRLYAAPSREAD